MNGPYTVPNPFEWRKYVDILAPSPDGGPPSGARRPTVLRSTLGLLRRIQDARGYITSNLYREFSGRSYQGARDTVARAHAAGVLRVVTPATSGRGGNQTRYELT